MECHLCLSAQERAIGQKLKKNKHCGGRQGALIT
jgi:hypothetical protein